MLKGRPHLSVGSLPRRAQVAGPTMRWRWLLVVLAWLALASGSVATAQGAVCHCPMASPAQAASQSQMTGKKAMPCCDHGKACHVCTWGNFVAPPLLPPSLGAPHGLRAIALAPPPEERWISIVPGAETPPPRSFA
jgi:hypothetical protein